MPNPNSVKTLGLSCRVYAASNCNDTQWGKEPGRSSKSNNPNLKDGISPVWTSVHNMSETTQAVWVNCRQRHINSLRTQHEALRRLQADNRSPTTARYAASPDTQHVSKLAYLIQIHGRHVSWGHSCEPSVRGSTLSTPMVVDHSLLITQLVDTTYEVLQIPQLWTNLVRKVKLS